MAKDDIFRAPRTGGPNTGGLSKSISPPSNFTRLQAVRPVQNKICVCLDERYTQSLTIRHCILFN